ncbi:MAG: penicillin-binding protein 1C, partial [Flavobacteriaceae bacterium]|nr:penicillin-binding protein 1C [Flavobacteriaceae bacterium]
TQRLARDVLSREADELARQGIHNGAIVVSDHRDGTVAAAVGNIDFWDAQHAGQMIAFDTPRSVGSTLKPLIYALAIERGLVLPGFLVSDVPTLFGAYRPRNYNGQFLGMVRLDAALSMSLNIPFVELLRKLGTDRLIGTLSSMNFNHLTLDPGHYGLSAAVGGVELTPLELTELYTSLAQGGSFRPLRWLRNAPKEEAIQLIAPGPVHLTRAVLSQRDRPDFPLRRKMSGAPANIHWKTGTSFGHRDAWAAGSNTTHSATVWLGNLDRTASRSLVGGEAAGPLLFDLLDGTTDSGVRPPRRPLDLTTVKVCSLSGRLPGSACPHREVVDAFAAEVPTERCPYHRRIHIAQATGLSMHAGCHSAQTSRVAVHAIFPARVQRYLSGTLSLLPKPPPPDPNCPPVRQGTGPSITSPDHFTILLMPNLRPDEQEIPFEADAPGDAQLSWFVDNAYLGTSAAGERLWWQPTPGVHQILVHDQNGRKSRRQVKVQAPK